MASPKFIADADLSQLIVAAVCRAEPAIDFLSASEGGTRGLSDPEVLSLAAASRRILVSHDRKTMIRHFEDFCSKETSPGLITIRQGANWQPVIESLVLIWSASSEEEWQNTSIFIPL